MINYWQDKGRRSSFRLDAIIHIKKDPHPGQPGAGG